VRSNRSQRVARAVGGALGLGLAVAVVLGARPSASADGLTATVRFSAPTSGELAVTPAAPQPFLVANSLRPGGNPAIGSFDIHNQTGRRMALAFRVHPSSGALNGLVQVRLSAGGRSLARTSLQGMLDGIQTSLQLPSGATRGFRLEAWMPRTVGDGYEGRLVDVSMIPAGARGRG
jgi:hypothetical protein